MRGVELKNCPFCGARATQPENWNKGSSRKPVWVICCASYCIIMKRGTKKQVIHDWNERANNKDQNDEKHKRVIEERDGYRRTLNYMIRNFGCQLTENQHKYLQKLLTFEKEKNNECRSN